MVFHPHSLDAPVSTDEDRPPWEMCSAGKIRSGARLDMQAVSSHWNELPERERQILAMRFYGNMTQAEIGQKLVCPDARVAAAGPGPRIPRECLLGTEQQVSYR